GGGDNRRGAGAFHSGVLRAGERRILEVHRPSATRRWRPASKPQWTPAAASTFLVNKTSRLRRPTAASRPVLLGASPTPQARKSLPKASRFLHGFGLTS